MQPLSGEKKEALLEMIQNGYQTIVIQTTLHVSRATITKYRNELKNNGGTSNNRGKFFGCDEDCFNCTYNDCYKPDHSLKSDPIIEQIIREG